MFGWSNGAMVRTESWKGIGPDSQLFATYPAVVPLTALPSD